MFRVRPWVLLVALGACVARADVVTTVSGSSLVVTGDSSPNAVAIEPALDGVTVVGFDGTLVDGSSEGITVPGVRRLTVKLGKGSDRLTLTHVTLPDGLDLRLGRGNDSVWLDDVDGGASRIQTGNGHDAVSVFDVSLNRLSVQTSNGFDFVELDRAWVSGDLDVDTGSDDDDVTIVATHIGDDVHVELGNDDDFALLADVAVDDDVEIDGEDGDDDLVFAGYIWIEDDLDVDGFGDDWWW
jgi:hypothetical protein